MTTSSGSADALTGAVQHADSVRFSDRFSAFVVDLFLLAGVQILVTFVLLRLLQAAGLRSIAPVSENAIALTSDGPVLAADASVVSETARFACNEARLQAVDGLVSFDDAVATCQDALLLAESPSSAAWIIAGLAFVAVTIGYHAFFEGTIGSTPGKRMVGLTVVDVHDGSVPVGLARAAVRSIIRQSPWWLLLIVFATSGSSDESTALTLWFVAGLGLGFVSLVSAALSPNGSSLHDTAARTRVSAAPGKAAAIVVGAPYDEEEE